MSGLTCHVRLRLKSESGRTCLKKLGIIAVVITINNIVRLESRGSLILLVEPSCRDLEEDTEPAYARFWRPIKRLLCITAGREFPISRQNNQKEQSLAQSWSPKDRILIKIVIEA